MNKIQKLIVFHPYLVGIAAFFLSLFVSCIPVFILNNLHVNSYFEHFRKHVGELSATLATVVDGDLHKQITRPEQINDELYKKAILPLVKFHNANPEMIYVYTMVEKNDKMYYILDTMSDERLNLGRAPLENTAIMEEVISENPEDTTWIDVQKSGQVYVNPDFETDNYGTFLSGHAPFYDRAGNIAGFVGIDYDTAGYEKSLLDFKKSFYFALIFCFVFSTAVAIFITILSSSLHKNYIQIEKLSKYDYLTGLYNRNTFQTLIERSIKTLRRKHEHLFFIIIDMDDFKQINDEFGHQVGDEAIKQVANILQSEIRDSDVLARYGGDEFLIYICDKNENAAQNLINRLEKRFTKQEIKITDEINTTLSLSIGYTKFKEDCDYEMLLNRADEALYISKATGKGIATFMA